MIPLNRISQCTDAEKVNAHEPGGSPEVLSGNSPFSVSRVRNKLRQIIEGHCQGKDTFLKFGLSTTTLVKSNKITVLHLIYSRRIVVSAFEPKNQISQPFSSITVNQSVANL